MTDGEENKLLKVLTINDSRLYDLLTNYNSDLTDKITTLETSISTVSSDLTTHKNASNPHNIAASTIGLGSVVNTGDTSEIISGSGLKFTSNGAYNLQTSLQSQINSLQSQINNNNMAIVLTSTKYVISVTDNIDSCGYGSYYIDSISKSYINESNILSSVSSKTEKIISIELPDISLYGVNGNYDSATFEIKYLDDYSKKTVDLDRHRNCELYFNEYRLHFLG